MLPINDIPIDRKLLGAVTIVKDESAKTKVSQEAEINGKKIKITLTFNRDIKASEAKEAMERNLDKVAQYTIAYKLGMRDGDETTRSLVLHRDKSLTRFYTKGSDLLTKHEITYAPQAVKSHVDQAICQYVKDHPIMANPRDLVEVPSYERANNMPPPVRSPIRLSSKQTEETGGYFKDKFVMDGKTYKEKALRANTVDMLRDGLKAKIEDLEIKIGAMGKEPIRETDSNEDLDFDTRFNAANAELKKAREDLKKYSESFKEGVTHGSTNTPRFAFIKMGREGAKKDMAPILSNLRIQTVENAEGKTVSAVTRSAAITDFRFGEVSLQELKDYKDLQDLNSLGAARLQELKNFYLKDPENNKLEDVALLVKAKALIGYGAKALIDEESYLYTGNLKVVLGKIQSSSSIEEGFKKLSPVEKAQLGGVPIKNEKLDEVIRERIGYLKQLVLQDLQLHLETTPVTDSTKPILYGRTALVDLRKAANNEAGCIIHERTQGLDMKAVFDELENATVVFEDVKAAYVDDEGVIHMPKKCAGKDIKGVNIKPVFFNICVQGHTANKGMQKAINDETLERLRNEYGSTREFGELEQSLKVLEGNTDGEKDPDPNKSVLLVNKFLEANRGYAGYNCYGGKDRTGYCVALITHDKIRELTGKAVTDEEMKAVGHQLLSPSGVAAKIAQDNADHTTLKLTRNDLLLFDVESIRGKMLRASQGADGIFMWIKANFKKAVGLSPLAVSSTPGQIYKDEAMERLNNPKKAGASQNREVSKKTHGAAGSLFSSKSRNEPEEIELQPLLKSKMRRDDQKAIKSESESFRLEDSMDIELQASNGNDNLSKSESRSWGDTVVFDSDEDDSSSSKSEPNYDI